METPSRRKSAFWDRPESARPVSSCEPPRNRFNPDPASRRNHIGSGVFGKKVFHENEKISFQLWDTAGNERSIRSQAKLFYRGVHVCVILYDITNRESFVDAKGWMEDVKVTIGADTEVSFFLVGTKVDLVGKRDIR